MKEPQELHYVEVNGTIGHNSASQYGTYQDYALDIFGDEQLTTAYSELTSSIGLDCEYLFIVPCLTKGGGDLLALNYVHAILDLDKDAKITVLATEDRPSPWKSKLPKRVRFVQLTKIFFSKLSRDDQVSVFGVAIRRTFPHTLHVINEPKLACRLVERFGVKLRSSINIYWSFYMLNSYLLSRNSGREVVNLVGWLSLLSFCSKKILTDNQTVIEHVMAVSASVRPENFSVHYQPNVKRGLHLKPSPDIILHDNLKILWAGRLDTQKRIDILQNIAKKSESLDLPIEFHVYGSSIVERNDMPTFAEHRNIVYGGPFDDGLWNLPCKEFDAFLLTSQGEGMPNAVIQAIDESLVVIAPDVGGVKELVNSRTGFLVPKFDDIPAYIDALRSILSEPNLAKLRHKTALEIVRQRHSWKTFLDSVNSEDGYIMTLG